MLAPSREVDDERDLSIRGERVDPQLDRRAVGLGPGQPQLVPRRSRLTAKPRLPSIHQPRGIFWPHELDEGMALDLLDGSPDHRRQRRVCVDDAGVLDQRHALGKSGDDTLEIDRQAEKD